MNILSLSWKIIQLKHSQTYFLRDFGKLSMSNITSRPNSKKYGGNLVTSLVKNLIAPKAWVRNKFQFPFSPLVSFAKTPPQKKVKPLNLGITLQMIRRNDYMLDIEALYRSPHYFIDVTIIRFTIIRFKL